MQITVKLLQIKAFIENPENRPKLKEVAEKVVPDDIKQEVAKTLSKRWWGGVGVSKRWWGGVGVSK